MLGYIICGIITILTIILFRVIFKVNIKEMKKYIENKELSEITKRFPDNINIAKDILEILNNKNVKIEQAKDTDVSLYIAVTNKILIADMKNNYSRIQTIAHECLHSCQDRALLMFNFIFSNINIVYFLLIIILTISKVISVNFLYLFILLIFALIQFTVRAYLETDAMTKSKFLAKEYIVQKKLCNEEEKEKLLFEYDKINTIGIPFILYDLLKKLLLNVLIYIVICIVVMIV